jgi:CubicO group peptidase (beta-lactamase class C family)
MRKVLLIGVMVVAAVAIVAFLRLRPGTAARVATGLVSHTLCSETFVAGLDARQTFAETFESMPGIRRLIPLLRYEVDRNHGEVTATLAGRFERRAVYREGFGCALVYDAVAGHATGAGPPTDSGTQPANVPDIAGAAVVEPADERLRAALDRAFAEPAQGPPRGTKAVIVLHDDRVIAERYGTGYNIDTPLLAWSVSKSVVNALIGILVRQGRLSVGAPAPVPAWRDPSDPRHAITIEELMRMTSGLALAETNSGFDPSSRMLYTEPDMAGFAESAGLRAAPGTRYSYSSPSTLILSRIIRDAVGGRAEDVRRFAERELFDPLGMRHVTIEFDATGTPIGSTYMFATARDWARFGMLYMNDGVVSRRRILPEGWVRYSASPTPGARDGYGAGFFTNRGDSDFARRRVRGGMPADSFFASGTLGQRIVIAPAERLVVVRFGRAQDWPDFDIRGLIRLVAEVNALVNRASR